MSRTQKLEKLKGFVVLVERNGQTSVITPEDTSFYQTQVGAEKEAAWRIGQNARVCPARIIIEEPLF